MARHTVDEPGTVFSIATAPSTPRHRLFALVVVLATLAAYVAVTPFATVQLARVDSFVPLIFAVIFVADLVTAVLLFSQFSASGLRPLLVLASGYLFSSLVVIGYVLTFPGAVAPAGLLGGGPQSAAYLNVFWRFGFAAALAIYAVLRIRSREMHASEPPPRFAVPLGAAATVFAVFLLIFAATAGHGILPPLLSDGQILPSGRYANAAIVAMNLVALGLLVLTRGRTILDLWLIVVAFAALAESIMVTFFIQERYSLSFYAIRLIALPVSKVVLIVLLWETMRLYASLAASNRALNRERASRLSNAAAVAAAIVHEMRQPLTGMNLQAAAGQRSLDREAPDVGMGRKLFGDIKDAALRANEVFDNFFRLFRKGGADAQPVNVNALVLEGLDALRKDLEHHNITVVTELASDAPSVRGHRVQLREVLLNLIQTSLDAVASAPEGPRVITIATSRLGRSIVSLSLRDTGPGIEPESLTEIFDPFIAPAKGAGLGLAICKMIVDQHGGSLTARSGAPGQTRFEMTLPARAGRPAGGTAGDESESIQTTR